MVTWNYITLTIAGALVLFLGILFAHKTALQFIDWIKDAQPADKFSHRFLGFFYDWGNARMSSDESKAQPANVLVLILVEALLAVVLFVIPFFILKWVVLFLIAVILMGCAFFTARTVRSDSGKEPMPVAFIMPLQIYAAIKIMCSLIVFVGIAIYDFFKSAIAHTSSPQTKD